MQLFANHDSHKASGNNRPVSFEVLVKMGKKTRLFSGLCTRPQKRGPQSNIRVYEFTHLGKGRVSRIYAADPMENCAIQRLGGGSGKKKKKSSGRIKGPDGSSRGGAGGGVGGGGGRRERAPPKKKKKKKKPDVRFTKSEMNSWRVRKIRRTLDTPIFAGVHTFLCSPWFLPFRIS